MLYNISYPLGLSGIQDMFLKEELCTLRRGNIIVDVDFI